jgi:hypothetical protein
LITKPTEGFVINKKVGDYNGGWNGRKAWTRIYDPRGFEFEISVENLIYILEHCNSIKGKGIEGEFVYSWDGKDLVLLPVNTVDYTESRAFTDAKSKKVTKKDMVEGCVYKTKNLDTVVYLGRHEWNDLRPNYSGYHSKPSSKYTKVKHGKRHIFFNKETDKFVVEKGFTKLSERVTTDHDTQYAELYNRLMTSAHTQEMVEVTVEATDEHVTHSNIYGWHSSILCVYKGDVCMVQTERGRGYYNDNKHLHKLNSLDELISDDYTTLDIDTTPLICVAESGKDYDWDSVVDEDLYKCDIFLLDAHGNKHNVTKGEVTYGF